MSIVDHYKNKTNADLSVDGYIKLYGSQEEALEAIEALEAGAVTPAHMICLQRIFSHYESSLYSVGQKLGLSKQESDQIHDSTQVIFSKFGEKCPTEFPDSISSQKDFEQDLLANCVEGKMSTLSYIDYRIYHKLEESTGFKAPMEDTDFIKMGVTKEDLLAIVPTPVETETITE